MAFWHETHATGVFLVKLRDTHYLAERGFTKQQRLARRFPHRVRAWAWIVSHKGACATHYRVVRLVRRRPCRCAA